MGDPCSSYWSGVTCNGSSVVGIALEIRHIVGTLPAQLGSLAALKRLLLANNSFVGPLPTTLGALAGLTSLSLGGNAGLCGTQVSVGGVGTTYSTAGAYFSCTWPYSYFSPHAM